MRGDGLGGFTQSVLTADITPLLVTGGDFNNDGRPDLVITSFNPFNAAILLNECPQNTPPTITAAAPLSRERGQAATPSTIATVSDPDQSLDTLSVTATSLTGSGVTVSGISVDASGNVTASVGADCTAI